MTQRSYAYLISALADNTTGDITPEVLRDFLDTVVIPDGKISMNGNATATTIGSAGTFVKVAGTTVAGGNGHLTTEGTANRITYTGPENRHFTAMVTVTFKVSAVNQVVSGKLAKNGVVLDDTLVTTLLKASGDEISMICVGDAVLAENDYLEYWITNETNTNDITIVDMYFSAMGMFH